MFPALLGIMKTAMLYKGYAFRLDMSAPPPGVWKSCSSECWDTVVIDDLTGTYMGDRLIDGAKCRVICHKGEYYAAR